MTEINAYIPIKIRVRGDLDEDLLESLGETLQRMITRRMTQSQWIMKAGSDSSRSAMRAIPPTFYGQQPLQRSIYYKTDLPVSPAVHKQSAPASGASSQSTGQANSQAIMVQWTSEMVLQHILQVFGTYGPDGQTHYGVQVAGTLYVVADVVNGHPQLQLMPIDLLKEDVKGHLQSSGEKISYGQGRYVFEVVKDAPDNRKDVGSRIGYTTTLQGQRVGGEIYAPDQLPIGYRVVFDVPTAAMPDQMGQEGKAGTRPKLISLQCSPQWDTAPLTDPAYSGMSDEELFHLFLNLCNARAIDNLDLSKRYIQEQLLPLYVGPGGSTSQLSDYSRHNIEHLRDDLKVLRGLMIALNKLTAEMRQINQELDSLIMTHHRIDAPPLPFLSPRIETYWPTYHPPNPRDAARVKQLQDQAQKTYALLKEAMNGIVGLVSNNPLLTQFIRGLEIEGSFAKVPNAGAIDVQLIDEQNPEAIQKQVIEVIHDILASIEKARSKLCDEPERVLDVPVVYQQVLAIVKGVNPRFDKVALDGIEHHQRREHWIDIGIMAAGLVLLVGGLIVSLFGGPAGVGAYIGLASTVLGVGTAIRSFNKADFLSSLAGASVGRGQGMVTLEAAHEAEFYAALDAVFAVIDVGAEAARAAKGVVAVRKAEALAKVEEGASEFTKTAEASEKITIDELVKQRAQSKQILLNEDELDRLQKVKGGRDANREFGKIVEEAVERVIGQDEYLLLGTKLTGDQGIDLFYIRRSHFERVFGKLAHPEEASAILGRATPEQMEQLRNVLKESNNIEDLISIETKFTSKGEAIEEILGKGYGGIQQNQVWYKGILPRMLQSADAEVQATGRLLEVIIGSEAENVDRLRRIGITVDANGSFALTRLNDDIINLAARSKALRGRAYYGQMAGLIEAEKKGNAVRIQKLRSALVKLNQEIEALDKQVAQARNAFNRPVVQQAQEALQRAAPALKDIGTLSAQVQTPAIIEASHVATATARLYLSVARRRVDEAEQQQQSIEKTSTEANKMLPQYEAALNKILDEWVQEEPGIKERILREVEQAQ